jgi:hypothetical protein
LDTTSKNPNTSVRPQASSLRGNDSEKPIIGRWNSKQEGKGSIERELKPIKNSKGYNEELNSELPLSDL